MLFPPGGGGGDDEKSIEGNGEGNIKVGGGNVINHPGNHHMLNI